MESTSFFEQRLKAIFQDDTVHQNRILPKPIADELILLIQKEFKITPCLHAQNPLSLREMLCLLLLASGKNPPRCADILNISVNSVITYETRIRKKLGARTRTEALFLALKSSFSRWGS